MNISRCKNCGKPIEWIEHRDIITGEIKKIPLDPRQTTYRFDFGHLMWIKSDAMVSHLAICPKANDLSEPKKDSQHWWNRD